MPSIDKAMRRDAQRANEPRRKSTLRSARWRQLIKRERTFAQRLRAMQQPQHD